MLDVKALIVKLLQPKEWQTSGIEAVASASNIGFTATGDGLCWIRIKASTSSTAYLYIKNSSGGIVCTVFSVAGLTATGVFPIRKDEVYSYAGGTNLASPVQRQIYYFQ